MSEKVSFIVIVDLIYFFFVKDFANSYFLAR